MSWFIEILLSRIQLSMCKWKNICLFLKVFVFIVFMIWDRFLHILRHEESHDAWRQRANFVPTSFDGWCEGFEAGVFECNKQQPGHPRHWGSLASIRFLAMNCHPKHTWLRWVFRHRPKVEAQTGFSYWRWRWHRQHSVRVSEYPLLLVGSNWSRLFWGWSTDQTGSPMHSERPEERGVSAVACICSRLLGRGQRRARGRPPLCGGRDSKLPRGMSLLWLVYASCRRQSQSECHHWTGSDIIAVTHIQCGKFKYFTILS